ncbi:unannotated protein [freshwater metagenome]|uniref:Unannotated protein n=1 Tax=freshwater metagenome TaxID=449393 RepID=A0A6J7JKQ1_9ZZZZ
MPGVLATEDSAGAGHLGLDEGVPHSRAQGNSAVLAHHLRHRVRGDQVVDDRGPRHLGQLANSDQGREGRGVDHAPGLIDHEAAVGVTIEGKPDVGTLGDDTGLQVDQVGRLDGVGLVVGERPVEFEVHRHDVEGKGGQARSVAEYGGNGVATHAVASVDDHTQSATGQRNKGAQKRRVGHQHVLGTHRARRLDRLGGMGQQRLLEEGADFSESRVLTHGGRPRPAELDAVVLGRIVTGGKHRARHVE